MIGHHLPTSCLTALEGFWQLEWAISQAQPSLLTGLQRAARRSPAPCCIHMPEAWAADNNIHILHDRCSAFCTAWCTFPNMQATLADAITTTLDACCICKVRKPERLCGYKCSRCLLAAVCLHNCLATIAPDATQYWNYSKNEKVPEQVVAGSNAKVSGSAQLATWNGKRLLVGVHAKGLDVLSAVAQTKSSSLTQHLLKLSLPAWPSGTTSAMMPKTSTQTTPLLAAIRW